MAKIGNIMDLLKSLPKEIQDCISEYNPGHRDKMKLMNTSFKKRGLHEELKGKLFCINCGDLKAIENLELECCTGICDIQYRDFHRGMTNYH